MNVYRNPAAFGLEIIMEADIGESYSFNRMVIFSDLQTGDLYFAQDSGCSCPSPFEDLISRSDLTRVSPENMEAFEQESSRYFDIQAEFMIRHRVRLKRAAEAAKRKKEAEDG